MAKQYNTKALLQDQIDEENVQAMTWKIPMGICFVCGVASLLGVSNYSSLGILAGISFVLMIIFAVISSSSKKTTGLERVRTGGHYDLVKSLSQLPDAYHIIYGVPLKAREGCESTLEAIVIGPSGIHVIGFSCKHGKMVGNKKDDLWLQHNVGCGGTPYTNEFKNPTRFLAFQCYVLKEFLRNQGIDALINGRYFFLNAHQIETNCFDQCFCDLRKLEESIVNRKKQLSNVQIRHLVRLLGYEPQ